MVGSRVPRDRHRTTYAILRIWLCAKPPSLNEEAEYVRCATWVIPCGVSSFSCFFMALGGASTRHKFEGTPLFSVPSSVVGLLQKVNLDWKEKEMREKKKLAIGTLISLLMCTFAGVAPAATKFTYYRGSCKTPRKSPRQPSGDVRRGDFRAILRFGASRCRLAAC